MFEVYIKKHFSAAHKLIGYNGNCSKLHGHNWAVTVFLRTNAIDEIGISIDFRFLGEKLEDILSELDHADLNAIKEFKEKNPTSELIAKYIFDKLKSSF